MIVRDGERLLLSGQLTMATVPEIFTSGLQYLRHEDLLLDFLQVETVDSAAVSMLLGWSRAVQNDQRSLRVVNLPEALLSLAHLYGVAELLPQQGI